MLYLVEGLNCSGKSTFIQDTSSGNSIVTDWLNPRRWTAGGYKDMLKKLELTTPYLIGAYETFYRSMRSLGFLRSKAIYVDRTWISAYAYGTIGELAYQYLLSIHSQNDVVIVFMDTPVEVCWERWKKLKLSSSKAYVNSSLQYWKSVDKALRLSVSNLETLGFQVNRMQGA